MRPSAARALRALPVVRGGGLMLAVHSIVVVLALDGRNAVAWKHARRLEIARDYGNDPARWGGCADDAKLTFEREAGGTMSTPDPASMRPASHQWARVRAVRRLLTVSTVVGALTTGVGSNAQAALRPSAGPCAERDAERTGIVQGALQAFLDRDDDVARMVRTARGLPGAPGVVARFVVDPAVCRRLRRAVDSLSGRWGHPSFSQPDSTRAVFVFHVDSLLVVLDLDGVRPETRSDWQVFRPAGIRVGQWR